MDAKSRVRRRVGLAAAFAAIAALGALPAGASADIVGNLVNTLGNAVGGGGSGPVQQVQEPAPAPAPQAESEPRAQGTVAEVDAVVPDSSGDSPFAGEEVVVGRSDAQQDSDRRYHGHVTILGLLGEEVLGVESEEGESARSPLQPVQDVLDQVCTGSQNNVCLALLVANSATSTSGSVNEFGVARADLFEGALSAGAAESNGSLTESGSCQTATAGSEVARAESPHGLDLHILKSSSTTTACKGLPATQQDDSTVAELNGNGLPDGCTGTENGNIAVDGLATIACNAGVPGSRDALALTALPDQQVSAGATGASAASAAAAPGADTPDPAEAPGPGETPTPTEGTGNQPGAGPDDGGDTSAPGDGSDPAGPATSDAQPGGDDAGSLAFTGSNLVLLAALGLALLVLGSAMVRRLDKATPRS